MEFQVKHLDTGDKFDILGTTGFWWIKGEKTVVCMTKSEVEVCHECVNGNGGVVYICEDQIIDSFQRKPESDITRPKFCECGCSKCY